MSKYIIDIPKTVGMLEAVGSVHYTYFDGIQVQTIVLKGDEIEELNSDYINDHFGDMQDMAYQKGLEDAWEAARKVALNSNDGGLSIEKLDEIFDRYTLQQVLKEYTAKQTIEKLKAYEEKQKVDDKIEAGDEVKAEDGTVVFFVTWMSDRCICGVDKEGKCYSYEPKEICGKTGRHFDIILEDMRHD